MRLSEPSGAHVPLTLNFRAIAGFLLRIMLLVRGDMDDGPAKHGWCEGTARNGRRRYIDGGVRRTVSGWLRCWLRQRPRGRLPGGLPRMRRRPPAKWRGATWGCNRGP